MTDLVKNQRLFFANGKTKEITFRMAALKRLQDIIKANETAIAAALHKDLGKSSFESYMAEIGMVLSELHYMRRWLPWLASKRPTLTPIAQFAANSFILREPYGVVLVMSPWNYPFMLCMDPLIGALAAGNCAILKPSAYAPATSAVIASLIAQCFPPSYVTVVQGGRVENAALLEERFDYIFFTGSVTVGKLVMEKAAANLTPVTLELGGKSPCIVDKSASLRLAAKRIVFGKFLNLGQTCVAPDYLLVQQEAREELVFWLKKYILACYGKHPLNSPDYGKIVNQKHFSRLTGLLEGESILFGGESDPSALRLSPTLLYPVLPDRPVMQEEIFGPILPILTFSQLSEAIRFVNSRPKPLALYLFSTDSQAQRRILQDCSFGGGCINDTIIHLATSRMGFGGVGESGMGSYHGKRSFLTFSHEKSVVKKANWIDLPMRYPPYTAKNEALLRRFLK